MFKCINPLLLGLLLLASSCLKQDAPSISPDYDSVVGDSQRLNSCTNVNFNKGFLKRDNIIDLFICTRWARKFPTLFQSLNDIPRDSWNHVMGPVDKVFFDNEERRDRMINNLRELDKKGGLDGLGRVLTSLNETNFYDAFYELFVCAENPSDEVCEDRDVVLNKQEIQTLLRGLHRSPDFYTNAAVFFNFFLKSLAPYQEDLKDSVKTFYKAEEFKRARLYLANEFFKEIADGLSDQSINEWRGLLSGGGPREGNFLFDWMNAGYMNEDKFDYLVTYPIKERPTLLKEHKVVEKAIQDGMVCFPSSENNYLSLDIEKELQTFMQALRERTHSDFLHYLSQKGLLLRSAETFCDKVRDYPADISFYKDNGYITREKYSVDFLEQLQKTSNLMSRPPFFDFLSFLEFNSNYFKERSLDGFILLEVITSPYAQQFIKLNKSIVNKTDDYFRLNYQILKGLPSGAYKALDGLLREILDDHDMRQAIVQLAEAWDFYTDTEKQFFFTFLDKHMESGVKYFALFEFYQQTLTELPAFSTQVSEQWFASNQTQDQLYSSLKDFTRLMSGGDVLKDFKVFFSRDHIIEIIKVITRGEGVKASKLADNLFIDQYLSNVTNSDYELSLDADSADREIYKCLNEVLSDDQDFYSLIISLPSECTNLSQSNIVLSYFHWMNELGKMLNDFTGDDTQAELFFSKSGLFSPRLMGAGAALADSVDESLSHGLSGLVEDISYHLFRKPHREDVNQLGYNRVVGEFLRSFWPVLNFDKKRSRPLRNKALKYLTSLEDQRYSHLIGSASRLLSGYGVYLQDFDENFKIEYNAERFRLPCHDFLNQNVGYRCPETPDDLLKELLTTVDILGRTYDGVTTPLGNILAAASVEHGQPIPLNSKDAVPYRLSLKETFELQYDLTDKDREINNIVIPYEKVVDGGGEPERLTTMERIEVVIRDVSFRYNYLGVQYLNSVSQGENYNEDVESRKKLMQRCIKIPIIRCGKRMTDDQQRRGENALEAYDGLLDVNNGRGLDPDFVYGKYMKSLLSAIVGSSDKEAQEVRFFPLGEDVLKKHNGLLLGSLTRMGFFTHLGRWVQARFTDSDQTLEQVLNWPAFKLLDRSLLAGMTRQELQDVSMRLSETLNTAEGRKFVQDATTWIFNLEKKDLDMVEKVLGRAVTILSYIGPPEKVLGQKSHNLTHFENNNWDFLLDLGVFGIQNWSRVKASLPESFNLNDTLRAGYQFFNYLFGLEAQSYDKRTELYVVINEVYLFAKHIMESPLNDRNLLDLTRPEYNGYDYFSDLLKKKRILNRFISKSSDLFAYLESLKYDEESWNYGRWHRETGKELEALTENSNLVLSDFKNYLYYTSMADDCRRFESQKACRANPHYDEVFKLIGLLSDTDEEDGPHFESLMTMLFKDNKDQISKLLDEILQVLVIAPRDQE